MKRKASILFLSVLVFACKQAHEEPEVESPTLVERTEQIYVDFSEGNVDGVIARWHPEIVWNEAENFLYAEGNPYVGPTAVMEGVFGPIQQDWDNFRTEELDFHTVDSNAVLVTGRYRGVFKDNGVPLDAQFAHLWTYQDSLVVSFQQYTDTRQAAEIAEATEVDMEPEE